MSDRFDEWDDELDEDLDDEDREDDHDENDYDDYEDDGDGDYYDEGDDDDSRDEDDSDEDEHDEEDLDLDALDLDEELDADLTELVEVSCPYCGEDGTIAIDPVGGDVQEYVEDCEVCCQPWSVHVTLDTEGAASVEVDTLDEG